MKMKRLITVLLIGILAVSGMVMMTGCGAKGGSEEAAPEKITIAIPNDTTNEARALILLEENGYIKLAEGVDIGATPRDVVENNNIEFKEVEAAQLPNTLQDVDFAVINSNYAIDADLNPVKDSLIMEGSAAVYANILAVKEGNENEPKIKALVAALASQKVKDFIEKEYGGAVVSSVDEPTDGFDADVDYDKLKGEKISVACSPAPHAEILKVAKEILKEKDITLDIKEFTDYVQPNNVVESGEIDANYFQHTPYLDDFNAENGTHIVSVLAVHNEPMGMYAGKQTSLDVLKKVE